MIKHKVPCKICKSVDNKRYSKLPNIKVFREKLSSNEHRCRGKFLNESEKNKIVWAVSHLFTKKKKKSMRISKDFSWNDGEPKHQTRPKNTILVWGVRWEEKWGKSYGSFWWLSPGGLGKIQKYAFEMTRRPTIPEHPRVLRTGNVKTEKWSKSKSIMSGRKTERRLLHTLVGQNLTRWEQRSPADIWAKCV